MSLRPPKPGTNDRPLYGVDEISLPKNAVLVFSHPAVKKNGKVLPLYVYSGATAIQWAYSLNTQTTPTIGGEVVQVLSASAGPMTITGQVAGLTTTKDGRLDTDRVKGYTDQGGRTAYAPNHELFEIVKWFQTYMESAGTNTRGNVRRDERAIDFKYPERNWHFKIMVTELAGFRYDVEVIAPEWSITAEIVSDNALDYFSGVTMGSFTELISDAALLGTIGLSSFAQSGTQTSNGAFGNTGDFGSRDPFLNPMLSTDLTSAKQFGDNFQQLVASWSAGNNDFAQGAFGALLDNGANPSNVDQVYQSLFGSEFIGGPTQTTSGGGSTSTGTAPATSGAPVASYTSAGALALAISQAFEAQSVPGYVGVAAALQESGMNPDRTQDSCTTANCGIGLFQVNGDGTGRDSSSAVKIAGQNRVYESTQGNITKYYPASAQIAAGAAWFGASARSSGINFNTASPTDIGQFIKDTQGAGDPNYVTEVVAKFSQAKQLIGSGAVQSTAAPLDGTGTVRTTVVNWATQFISKYTGTYSEDCRRDVENITPGDYSALPTSDCSNTVALFYCWGTSNNPNDGTNGSSFNNSTTDTMWDTASEIDISKARAGDMVIFGNSASDSQHVVMLMADYSGPSTQCFSFGQNPPSIHDLSIETAYFAGRGYGQHAFMRLP